MEKERIDKNVKLLMEEIKSMEKDLETVKTQKIRDYISVRISQLKKWVKTYQGGLFNN